MNAKLGDESLSDIPMELRWHTQWGDGTLPLLQRTNFMWIARQGTTGGPTNVYFIQHGSALITHYVTQVPEMVEHHLCLEKGP